MQSYSIYAGISHSVQLAKLRTELVVRIRQGLEDIAADFGGRRIWGDLYHIPPALGETARKTYEAASAMFSYLREFDRELYGVTVMVAGVPEDGDTVADVVEQMLLSVPEINSLWVAPEVLDDFEGYYEVEVHEGLFRVRGTKELGLRLEERLPRLLVRAEKLEELTRAVGRLEVFDTPCAALMIQGCMGAGKRATLKAALERLYPDDGGDVLTIPFSPDEEDPMEPFIRTLGPPLDAVASYLDGEERLWWESEGFAFLERCRQGRLRDDSRDQGPVDLVQAFALYLRSRIERRRKNGRPVFMVLDGFTVESESFTWLRGVLDELPGRENLRLLVLLDKDRDKAASAALDISDTVQFSKPGKEEWNRILEGAVVGEMPGRAESGDMARACGADMHRLFHHLVVKERKLQVLENAGTVLVNSLDEGTRCTLFLVDAAAGLANRQLLTGRFGSNEEALLHESARYDGLMDLGLIREDPDGRVRPFPGPWTLAESGEEDPGTDYKAAARAFGAYLFERCNAGDPVDLHRLYRYLERWGPQDEAVAALDALLENMLDNRRLRAAGRMLKGPQMPFSKLDGVTMKSLQNAVGAARLRHSLLSGDAEEAQDLVRDGRVSLIGVRGAYEGQFRLHNARFHYAAGRWTEALTAAKEALFTFQKAGDHEGETHSHIELALALLAMGKVRDASEHFGIARRIGTQVSASWGVLRASAMESVASYLFGNLPRTLRDCEGHRKSAHAEGRRDLWLLMTLIRIRICWELGKYKEAAHLAQEGQDTASFYGLENEQAVMAAWRGRCLLSQHGSGNHLDGRRILLDLAGGVHRREARAFLAESSWFAGRQDEAREYIRLAAADIRAAGRLQGEADDWSDGFFPIEGRLSDETGPLDALGEWIGGFEAYMSAVDGGSSGGENLRMLLQRGTRRGPRPFSYQYALWAALVSAEPEEQTRFISRAFNDLQARAGRFDDNQTKHAWLTHNKWNKAIMNEAQRRKFL